MAINLKNCGCKGIRTCLVCEKVDSTAKLSTDDQEVTVFNYCPSCNACFSSSQADDGSVSIPFHIRGILLVPEFVTKEEETYLVNGIDRIPWTPSQSGRRKQDFGPKVNFKKRKVKPGDFKGFPKFTEVVLQRMRSVPLLSNFEPVELCHLEYCPDRGSAIDPHLDDSWLWGERLVTVNLLSETTLLLSPTGSEFAEKCGCDIAECHLKTSEVPNVLSPTSSESAERCGFNVNECRLRTSNIPGAQRSDVSESAMKCICNVDGTTSDVPDCVTSNHELKCPPKSSTINEANDEKLSSLKDSHQSCVGDLEDADLSSNSIKCDIHNSLAHNLFQSSAITDRKIQIGFKKQIRLCLPPRSLLVLSDCARHHWYHEIQRQDVVSRRLAMTFRELSDEFSSSGKECDTGLELLKLAQLRI